MVHQEEQANAESRPRQRAEHNHQYWFDKHYTISRLQTKQSSVLAKRALVPPSWEYTPAIQEYGIGTATQFDPSAIHKNVTRPFCAAIVARFGADHPTYKACSQAIGIKR